MTKSGRKSLGATYTRVIK